MQVKTGVTFANLIKKILAEAHPRLTVEEELSHSCLEMVFVEQSKESLSEVDDKLPYAHAVDDHDVCKAFGQYVKFQVARQESEPAAVCNMLETRILLCGVKNMICDV